MNLLSSLENEIRSSASKSDGLVGKLGRGMSEDSVATLPSLDMLSEFQVPEWSVRVFLLRAKGERIQLRTEYLFISIRACEVEKRYAYQCNKRRSANVYPTFDL